MRLNANQESCIAIDSRALTGISVVRFDQA
jgi:hypothetical protein